MAAPSIAWMYPAGRRGVAQSAHGPFLGRLDQHQPDEAGDSASARRTIASSTIRKGAPVATSSSTSTSPSRLRTIPTTRSSHPLPLRARATAGDRAGGWTTHDTVAAVRAPGSGPVLVTGASGFIGRRVVARLVAAGRPVRAFLFPGEDAARVPGLVAPGVELVRGDVTDAASVTAAVRGASRVIDLAAVVGD